MGWRRCRRIGELPRAFELGPKPELWLEIELKRFSRGQSSTYELDLKFGAEFEFARR